MDRSNNKIDRRTFLVAAGQVGLGVAISSLLASCGNATVTMPTQSPAAAPLNRPNTIDLPSIASTYQGQLNMQALEQYFSAIFLHAPANVGFIYQGFIVNNNQLATANHVVQQVSANSQSLALQNRIDAKLSQTVAISAMSALPVGYNIDKYNIQGPLTIGNTGYEGVSMQSETLLLGDAGALSTKTALNIGNQPLIQARQMGLDRLLVVADLASTGPDKLIPRLQLLILDNFCIEGNFGAVRIAPHTTTVPLFNALVVNDTQNIRAQADLICPGTSGAPVFSLLDIILSAQGKQGLSTVGFVSGGVGEKCGDGQMIQFTTPQTTSEQLASANIKELRRAV
jgi:hypothetical protein